MRGRALLPFWGGGSLTERAGSSQWKARRSRLWGWGVRGKAVGSRARVVLKKSLVRVRACPVSGDCGFGADRAPTQNPTDHEETSREPRPIPAPAKALCGAPPSGSVCSHRQRSGDCRVPSALPAPRSVRHRTPEGVLSVVHLVYVNVHVCLC